MVIQRKNKLFKPLARKSFLRKKFNIFLLMGIFFSFLSLALSTITVIHAEKNSGKVLSENVSQITNEAREFTTITITIPPTTPTLIPTKAPTPTIVKKKALKDPTSPTPAPNSIDNTPTLNSTDKKYTAEKIGDSTYRVSNVENDSQMATPREIFDYLNIYRREHGKTTLSWDEGLGNFAQGRADLFASSGSLDSHAGFRTFMDNDGFSTLGFNGLGENSAMISGNMKSERIIKEIFGADKEHDDNQLDNSWEYVGVGVKDRAINLNFGKRKR